MKVIIAGGRDITEYSAVDTAMDMANLILGIEPTEIFSGRARGVDTLGEQWAHAHAIPVKPFPARWRDADGAYHPNAGKQRNSNMAAQADALVAVWDQRSTGTLDMIKKARKRGLLVWVSEYQYPMAQL